MTSNPDYIPLVDIIQGHFHKSFELIKMDCGLWLTADVVCGPQDEGFPTVLMSAATGCKLAKLGWNKIEQQNIFFQYFYPISGIHWTWKCHMYFSIYRSTCKHDFFTVSVRNGFTPFCITLKCPAYFTGQGWLGNLVWNRVLCVLFCIAIEITCR